MESDFAIVHGERMKGNRHFLEQGGFRTENLHEDSCAQEEVVLVWAKPCTTYSDLISEPVLSSRLDQRPSEVPSKSNFPIILSFDDSILFNFVRHGRLLVVRYTSIKSSHLSAHIAVLFCA